MPGSVFLDAGDVSLRTVEPEDTEFLRRCRNDPTIRRWLPRTRPQNGPQTSASIADADTHDTGGVSLLVCRDEEPLGLVSLFAVSADSGRAELSIWLSPDHHGEGYGAAAVESIVGYAFDERRLHRVVAGALADNEASRATLESVGFSEEGRQRDHYYVDGAYRDRIVYGLLETEWPSN